MTEPHSEPTLETTIFSNGNQAALIHVTPDILGDALLERLNITLPNALILLSAGTEKLEKNSRLRLLQLTGRGIVRAAGEIGIGFITRGNESEINNMLGQSIAERSQSLLLMGLTDYNEVTFPGKITSESAALIPLESHHTHFLLTNNVLWEKRVELLFRLVSELLNQQVPMITLLINGDAQSRLEVLRSVRLGIPVIVIAGSGQLADELASLDQNPPGFIPDPVLAEIVAEGNIHSFPLDGTPADLERLVHRQLWGDNTLKLAWEVFGYYDSNAARHQRHFQNMQLWILGLGVLVTLLAIFQTKLEYYSQIQLPFTATEVPHNALSAVWQEITVSFIATVEWLRPLMAPLVNVLSYVIMAIPIIITTLIAATNRFNSGKKWLSLRASAERVKREIFCYRAQAVDYSPQRLEGKTPEIKLSEQLQNIAYNLMQTEVNVSAIHPHPHDIRQYVAKEDDGISLLTAERYLKTRLGDQFSYYISKAKKLERQLTLLQSLIYVVGGISTLLAALGWELWIALTTTIVTALGSFIEYKQIEKSLMNVNQAATDLANIRGWWIALSTTERTKQANIDLLVDRTERVLQGEFSSWVQEMQEALETLREQQAKDAEGKSTEETKKVPAATESTEKEAVST